MLVYQRVTIVGSFKNQWLSQAIPVTQASPESRVSASIEQKKGGLQCSDQRVSHGRAMDLSVVSTESHGAVVLSDRLGLTRVMDAMAHLGNGYLRCGKKIRSQNILVYRTVDLSWENMILASNCVILL